MVLKKLTPRSITTQPQLHSTSNMQLHEHTATASAPCQDARIVPRTGAHRRHHAARRAAHHVHVKPAMCT